MELLTRSYNKDWNRIVYLKVLENEDAIRCINDPHTCKLILILDGNGFIKCNSKEAFIVAPSVICLNHTDTLIFEESKTCKLVALFFQPIALNDQLNYSIFHQEYYKKIDGTTLFQDLTLLNSFYEINSAKRQLVLLDIASSVILKQLLSKLSNELTTQEDDFWPCRSRSYFIELLFFMESLRQNESLSDINILVDKNKNQFIHNVIQYLNQNIAKKITLEELEKRFACNRNQINIEFQKELHTTVMKYFVQMRMQLASVILRDTEIPIQEVALRVGYSDVSYFSRTFKSCHGKTPCEYRNFFS